MSDVESALCSRPSWASSRIGFGLGVAIASFSVVAYGIMIVALLMLPETRGRSLASLERPA